MDDSKSLEHPQRDADPFQKFAQECKLCPQRVIKVTMRDHVDSLTFVKLSLHIEEVFSHSLTFAKFINEEQIQFVLYFVYQKAYLIPF